MKEELDIKCSKCNKSLNGELLHVWDCELYDPVNINKSSGLNIVGAKRTDGTEREENDYYATDPKAIQDLVKFVDIKGDVWENACGEGNLSKELEKLPGVNVISSDKVNRGYGRQIDFLTCSEGVGADWIITNPPYKFGLQWASKSLLWARNVALLMKLVFLESESRKKFFREHPPSKVLVYSKRLGIYKNNIKTKNQGLVAYAWFVWERDYKGKPQIDWI